MQFRLLAALLCAASIARPAVDVIHVKERTDVLDGKAFGPAGPYERIAATVHFRLDPRLEPNRGIVDLDLVPRDSDGMVRFTADLLMYKPRDPAKGNGTALIDIPNRGRILSVANFNRGSSSLDPRTAAEIGDALLMQHGFTIASIGWQFDEPDIPGRLGLKSPRLPRSITGLVRSEFVPDKSVAGFNLADRDHVPYPVVDEKDPANRLFVSDAPGRPRREIPRSQWRFVNGGAAVELTSGCEPGKIYELIYRATGAVPAGLGFAAVRDMASFLKFGESPMMLGDQRRFIKRTIAFGISQTGRFLRHMVYEGFHQDEKSRLALDGVWSHVAGAGRGSFNHRFAQPSRDGQPLLHYAWPADIFPFADAVMKDPLTGREDGLLARAARLKLMPKMFYTNNSYEYWGRAASLIHTTPDAARDVAPEPGTRIYFITGGQHGPGSLPLKRTVTRNLENPLDVRWALRGLLIAFHEWLKDGKEPPASLYPSIARSELANPAGLKYPAHIQPPAYPRIPQVLDFGPEFATRGLVTIEPPKTGAAYPILVPRVDPAGMEMGGLRLPEIDVPLGALAGWNLRAPSTGSPEAMIAFIGSYFPFDERERMKRYPDREAYLKQFRSAAESLAARRLVLASDVDPMVAGGAALWDATARAAKN